MLHLSSSCRYYLYAMPTDMRKGFDSLSGIVSAEMNSNIFTGDVFIFINKKRNQIKLLVWEGDGLVVYYKRLEAGTYELPVHHSATYSATITHEQLQFILQGISLKSVRKRKRYQQVA
jgi:transposase